jgi:hypothetical protein
MNLFERLKPEVLVLVNEFAVKWPMSGADLIETLEKHYYISNLRYGHAIELLGLIPYTPHLSPYDLFLDA